MGSDPARGWHFVAEAVGVAENRVPFAFLVSARKGLLDERPEVSAPEGFEALVIA